MFRYAIVFSLIGTTAWGAITSSDGINSLTLELTGAGIAIGEIDIARSSKFNFDSPEMSVFSTIPAGVYTQGGSGGIVTAGVDDRIDEHATLVAELMIGNSVPLGGVSPMAQLHSLGLFFEYDDNLNALGANQIATLNVGTKVRAINISIGVPLEFFESSDGRSHFTQFVDWSARRHDVLYTVAWRNAESDEFLKPQDNFNGITVASSEQFEGAGKWRKFSARNGFDTDTSDAMSIDLLAPGENISLYGWNDVVRVGLGGSSLATPHVTGTVALLQQHSQEQINASKPRFSANSQRHEVMKVVMMNAADKLDGVHGSSRDVIDSNDDNWLESESYNSPFIPLDDEMGAGHLNARRSVQQLTPGEYDPGPVPKIGWDYGLIGDGESVEYTLNASGYIAITLAWDRIVNHTGGNTYNSGDQFFPYADIDDVLNNLDIRLLTAGGITVAESISPDTSLEHIFFEIQNAGEYRIVVEHNGGLGTFQNYALAWWNGNASTPGDYNKNGSVGPEDYDVWKSNFGTSFADADGNENGTVDAADYTVWRDNLGASAGSGGLTAVPEPTSVWLLLAGWLG